VRPGDLRCCLIGILVRKGDERLPLLLEAATSLSRGVQSSRFDILVITLRQDLPISPGHRYTYPTKRLHRVLEIKRQTHAGWFYGEALNRHKNDLAQVRERRARGSEGFEQAGEIQLVLRNVRYGDSQGVVKPSPKPVVGKYRVPCSRFHRFVALSTVIFRCMREPAAMVEVVTDGVSVCVCVCVVDFSWEKGQTKYQEASENGVKGLLTWGDTSQPCVTHQRGYLQ
jgi:hypothetical protein